MLEQQLTAVGQAGGGVALRARPTVNGATQMEAVHVDATRAKGVLGWGRRRVLLLNATFEPLTALSLRRAVVLIVRGKAEVVHEDANGQLVHSASLNVRVPSVIRLSTFVRVPYRGRIPLTRAALMHRDRFRCGYCASRADTIDHIVPRSRGGQHTWENTVACCTRCNHRKADKLLSELGWQLRVVPRVPRGQHWRLLAGVSDTDPQWLPYLGEDVAA